MTDDNHDWIPLEAPYARLMKFGVVCGHDDDILCRARFDAIREEILKFANGYGQ